MVFRTLKPELLDALPPENLDAIHSRRDLRRFNRAMGNPAWFRDTLPQLIQPHERVLELGAGTGELREFLPDSRHLRWDGLDLAPRPPQWPRTDQWHQLDVRKFAGWADYPVVIANLFFHHLDDQDLAVLGQQLRQHARVLICSEPARGRRWQWLFRAVCLCVGANHVSRHDGHVSIAAGFRGDELSRIFGVNSTPWRCQLSVSPRGVYRMVAIRNLA